MDVVDSEPIPSTSGQKDPLESVTPNKTIKKEKNTQYSPYDDCVEIVEMESEIVEVADETQYEAEDLLRYDTPRKRVAMVQDSFLAGKIARLTEPVSSTVSQNSPESILHERMILGGENVVVRNPNTGEWFII
jgi:hypothetical protein